jgi:S1-C subfamily serine protease
MHLRSLAIALLATACLPPAPREPSDPYDGAETEIEVATSDLEAMCADGHQASCELLGRRGAKVKHGDLRLTGIGTCFAIAPDGLLVTAAHVIDRADAVAVQFGDGKIIDARVEKASSGVDLALLRIDTPTPRHVRVDPAVVPVLGQRVFTIGFPQPGELGLNAKFAEGTVSAVTGLGEEHLAQLSVPVHQGNSGGAVVTEDGALVAIVVAKVDDEKFYRDTGAIAGAISFATKLAFLVPMLPPATDAAEPAALDRAAAISLVEDATCKVLVGTR